MPRPPTGIVLGYHGCEESDGLEFIGGRQMEPSQNDYDWLGDGVYFWENSPARAYEWARNKRPKRIKKPFVVGAALDLGLCLDLTTTEGIRLLKNAYDDFIAVAKDEGFPIPANEPIDGKDADRKLRKLDCAVVRFFHTRRKQLSVPKIESVRALFPEDGELFPDSGFKASTHTQIAVRELSCIRGVFHVPPDAFEPE